MAASFCLDDYSPLCNIFLFQEKELFEKILDHFKEARAKREELLNNMDYVYSVLKDGSNKAREIASKKVSLARDAVGLIGRNY